MSRFDSLHPRHSHYDPGMSAPRSTLLIVAFSLALATALTAMFWWPLWQGGGLVGGDVYSYFFPQKTYFADHWTQGRLPLWNPLVGHGYPVLGESQTGSLYPPNLLLYRLLDVNAAYNVSQLLHLVLAFVGMTLFSRRLGLNGPGSILASVVYVFGWLPPRMCLEGAPIGAAYLPWELLCIESWLQSGRFRWLTPLPWLIGCHLLAGHYNLAFINLLVCMIWFVARLVWASDNRHARITSRRVSSIVIVAGMITLGFALAAPQVLATWELKQLSQRADVGAAHNPGYGHIPPLYLLQTIAPWMWYPDDIDFDAAMQQLNWGAYPAATNKVEAHLYFGLLPLVMALIATWRLRNETASHRGWLTWIALAVAATAYTTGWWLPITTHLPGFSYFMGPGRFGMITTFVVALLAGKELDRWTRSHSDGEAATPGNVGFKKLAITAIVLAVTLADLWKVSQWVYYAVPVAKAPLAYRDDSQLRQMSLELGPNTRLFAPGSNLATLTGFAASPPYLGLGPAEYFDPQLKPPYADVREVPDGDIDKQVEWLRWSGVTHLLCLEHLSPDKWPVELVWEGRDDMVNRAWGRSEPLYLYRLLDAPGRVRLVTDNSAIASNENPQIVFDTGDEVEIAVNSPQPATLVLADLWYPGWEVEINGSPTTGSHFDSMFRAVEVPAGQHVVTWKYRPQLVQWGYVVSGLAALGGLLLILTTCRRRKEEV